MVHTLKYMYTVYSTYVGQAETKGISLENENLEQEYIRITIIFLLMHGIKFLVDGYTLQSASKLTPINSVAAFTEKIL